MQWANKDKEWWTKPYTENLRLNNTYPTMIRR